MCLSFGLLLPLFALSSFCLLDFSNSESLSDVYVKECEGTKMRLSFTAYSTIVRYENYKKNYENCTRVRGNLEIIFLELTDDQYDLSFLENIREVDGYVLIFGNFVKKIRLTKLRVIRGLDLYEATENDVKRKFSLYVAQNSLPNNNSIGLEELQMPSLVEILNGHVLLKGNSRMCFGETTIDWNHIFVNNRYGGSLVSASAVNYTKTTCESTCDGSCTHGFCWGSGANMCQQVHTCSGKRCSKDNQPCDQQCIAGCTGVSNTECLSCRSFARDRSECVANCSAPYNHQTIDGWKMVSPEDKYAHGSKCVNGCAAGFVTQDGFCVQNCKAGYKVFGTGCVPCQGECPKTCPGTGGGWLHKDDLPKYKGCIKVEGNLHISNLSFYGHPSTVGKEITVEDLERLSDIEEITGTLNIQAWHPDFTSLRFLRNLRVVYGATEENYPFRIIGTTLVSLDLDSLHRVEKGVALLNNADLCYTNRINWTTIAGVKVYNQGNKNSTLCDEEGFICSSKCLANDGCMGSGEKSCITCPHFYLLDHTCSSNCSTQEGFYENVGLRGNRECRPCHKECKERCYGDGPEHCFECKHFSHQGVCVPECPSQTYIDAKLQCLQCNSLCNECTGNNTYLNVDRNGLGCNNCSYRTIRYEYENDNGHCIMNEDECNVTLYYKKTRAIALPERMKSQMMMTCKRCHPECIGCNGSQSNQCVKCRHFLQGDMCVAQCSEEFYHDGEGNCLPCHPECRVCNGTSDFDCITCKSVALFGDQISGTDDQRTRNITSSKKQCVSACPKHLFRIDGNGTEGYCEKRPLLSQFMEPKTAIPVFVFLFLVIFAGVVIFVAFWRKQKLRQKKAVFLGDEIPMITSGLSKAPDMSLLRLVKESELRRGNVIGSGAFGTVYKGIWIPDKENVKIPVAIKVLQEASNTNLNVELLDEARIMASVCHPYCVRILAVCMTSQMMLITQLMPLGCLLDYVRKEKSNISSRVMLVWSVQIAKGMKHLEQLGIVHRDLAARNILVQSPNQVKITDFGLAKLLDYEAEIHSEGGKMPIKWLALECIQHRVYTHKSDVWSYGVTLWEIFSYGSRPYENLQARQVPQALEKGERLTQPTICTIDVYMVLIKCWMLDVDSRPTFAELIEEFTRMAKDPGRFLVIQGDKLMRLPSQAPDAKDLVRLMSLPLEDDTDLMIMSGEEYLRPNDFNMEGSDGLISPCLSPLNPLSSIPEDVAYENSMFEEKRGTATEDDFDGTDFKKLSQQFSRERSQRYISDPCRNDYADKITTEDHKEKDKLIVDEEGYLNPQSANVQPSYLDLVDESATVHTDPTQNAQQYLDMKVNVGESRDNIEYLDNEDVCLTDEVQKSNKLNSIYANTGSTDKTDNKDSEYLNVSSKSSNLPAPYKRLPETHI